MRGHLLLKNCREDEVTRPAIERALKEDALAAVVDLLAMFRRGGWM